MGQERVSSTDLQFVFEGPAVQDGKIKAGLLAQALAGSSEVFTRANQMVNGEASKAVVLVQAEFKKGSFAVQVELVQEVAEHAKQLITAHPFVSATTLATIIGFISKNKEAVKDSLIGLFKWLKGKKPDKVTPVENNNVELTLGPSKKTVTTQIFNMYGDAAIRAGLERMTSPLRQDAIDRIAVKHEGTEQTAIEKPEATYFETEPLQLESENSPTEGERDTVLVVSKLSFTEGTTWTFFERGAVVVAKIEDETFWADVHAHKLKFGEGDMLRVRLYWKIERKRKLVQKNTILRVYEMIESAKQMRLNNI